MERGGALSQTRVWATSDQNYTVYGWSLNYKERPAATNVIVIHFFGTH